MGEATAQAHPNIAFIKYWGNRDDELRLPASPSFSMTLAELTTTTTVRWRDELASDELQLNGQQAAVEARERVSRHLDVMRDALGIRLRAEVESVNNFPMGAGIASSASAFAALTLAAAAAAGVNLNEETLSRLARRGSGSASRSIPGGYVVWHMGDDLTSYAESILPPSHWPLQDVIAVISQSHKAVGSSHGHTGAATSDLQAARLAGAEARLATVRSAVETRDFASFADVVEQDSNLMHAVMMTSRPPLFYWQPASLEVMDAVRRWRTEGISVCYTLDAGPNVHCLCLPQDAPEVAQRLQAIAGVERVLQAGPGDGARLVG